MVLNLHLYKNLKHFLQYFLIFDALIISNEKAVKEKLEATIRYSKQLKEKLFQSLSNNCLKSLSKMLTESFFQILSSLFFSELRH